MNNNMDTIVPDWLTRIRTADRETEEAVVPLEHLDEAREWLATILVDVPNGLVPHLRQLERFYQGAFHAPLSRCLMSASELDWPATDVRFRHTKRLTSQQLTSLAEKGLSSLRDTTLFPAGESTALAHLLLNPYALFDLSDLIAYSIPSAWQPRLEESGHRLVAQFNVAPPRFLLQAATMPPRTLSDDAARDYHDAGYTLARGLFDPDEIELLRRSAREDHELDRRSFGRADGEGGVVRLSLWNHPGDGIYGMFARCERMVRSCERLLGGEVYHYHSKMILKDAKVGGAWAWHQDYGYWYQNGVLMPLLTSVFVAVDRCTRENGCLQVIRGSHHCGRVNHVLTGEQAGADRERVDEILKRPDQFPLVHMDMEPGDALFFHSNLLHRSDQNRSESPRWAMICCYNAARNDPYKDSHHPRYTPLRVVPDTAIREVGVTRFVDDPADVAWLDDRRDTSARELLATDPPPS